MTNSTHQVISYANRPSSLIGRFAVHYATIMATLFLLNFVVFGLACFVLPRFAKMFREHRHPASSSLQVVYWASKFYIYVPGLCMVFAAILLLPLPLAFLTNRLEPTARRRKNLLLIVLLLVTAGVLLIGSAAWSVWSTYVGLT